MNHNSHAARVLWAHLYNLGIIDTQDRIQNIKEILYAVFTEIFKWDIQMEYANNPQQKLMGCVGKSHFRQYQAQNYTRCAKIALPNVWHTYVLNMQEYGTNNLHATSPCPPNLQMVIGRSSLSGNGHLLSSGRSRGREDVSRLIMAKSSTAWRPRRLVKCSSPSLQISLTSRRPRRSPATSTSTMPLHVGVLQSTISTHPWPDVVETFPVTENHNWLKLMGQPTLAALDPRTAHQTQGDLAQFLPLRSTTDVYFCTVKLHIHMKMIHVFLQTIH